MKEQAQKTPDYPLHERIRYLRRLRELTQAELAAKAGITQGSLAHFESGKHSPSVQTLMALGKALELSPAIFFNNDEVLVFDLQRINRRYKTLDELPDRLYRDLSTIAQVAQRLGVTSAPAAFKHQINGADGKLSETDLKSLENLFAELGNTELWRIHERLIEAMKRPTREMQAGGSPEDFYGALKGMKRKMGYAEGESSEEVRKSVERVKQAKKGKGGSKDK